MATGSHHHRWCWLPVQRRYRVPVCASLTAPCPEVGAVNSTVHRGRLPRFGYLLSVPRWWRAFRS